MKRIAATILFVLGMMVVRTAGAQAVTLVMPNGQSNVLYQNLVNTYFHYIPTVDRVVTVNNDIAGLCGNNYGNIATSMLAGCANYSDDLIVLQDHNGQYLAHELGHIFDADVLSPEERDHLQVLMGNSSRPWIDREDYSQSPNEQFAEAYRMCAVYGVSISQDQVEAMWEYRYHPYYRSQRKVCTYIRSLSSMPGTVVDGLANPTKTLAAPSKHRRAL